MKKEQNTRVGIYHRDELNRWVLMRFLGHRFNCVEIKTWEEVERAEVDILILNAPELIVEEVTLEEITKVVERHRANVLMINNDKRKWWIHRLKFIQLRNPTLMKLLESITKLNPENNARHASFFGAEVRA